MRLSDRWYPTGWWLVLALGGLCGLACGEASQGYSGSCPLGYDCALGGTALEFRVRSTNRDFFHLPWPADARTTAEGTMDLAGFPDPGDSSLLRDWLETIQRTTRGFGTNSAIYFSFDGPLDPGSLPADPASTLEAASGVFLVDISSGPDRGLRIPLVVRTLAEAQGFTPTDTLVLRPMLGFSLRESTRYAAVVTREVLDRRGHPLGAISDFERTKYLGVVEDEGLHTWWQLLGPVYDELETLGQVERSRVAALTVFTTQAIVKEMDAVFDFVELRPVPPIQDWSRLADGSAVYRFEGWFDMPEFQDGEPPSFQGGGGFVFDQAGVPQAQRTPRVPFTLAVPRGAPPADGWPVVMYSHGTGADRHAFCDEQQDPCNLMAAVGIASIGIDQPLHGDRNPWGADPMATSFNVTNIEALRDNFRQGAADLLVLHRLLQDLRVPASVSPSGEPLAIDASRVGFMGHSHGGITGPIYLGAARDVKGAVLSGAGGGLNVVLLQRKDPVDLRALIVLAMGIDDSEFDLDHPVLNVFQAFAERADPLNYAPRIFLESAEASFPTHLFYTEGLHDLAAMPTQIEILASASGCALMTPVAREVASMRLRQVQPEDPPVAGNATGPRGEPVTAVLAQYPNDDHFVIFRNADARRHYTGFLDTLMREGLPSVGP